MGHQERVEAIAIEILAQYPIKRAAFFGSAARMELNSESDVDILVEFLPNTRGLEFFGLRVDLEDALGRPVDLITWNALAKSKAGFKQNVEREVRLIYER